jgi:hypothetical protein
LRLIHNVKYFIKEEILNRAEKYEFPNPLAVELFLWDCELAAQLQYICDDVILKGGTAAQLYLPLEKQRGSRDIDVATSLGSADVQETILKTSKSLEGVVTFRRYTPRKPVPNLPLVTYLAKTSDKLNETKELEVKIDISYNNPKLPCLTLEDIQTYAVTVERMKCLSAGALMGDKILTLAKKSVGLKIESDYPKQIYDMDALLESERISTNTIVDMVASVKTLTPIEASLRKINVTPIDALRDVAETMNEYSEIDTSGADMEAKSDIERFQQFYVNKNQRKPYYEWASKALRIKFLATLIIENIEGNLTESKIASTIEKCQEITLKINKVSGEAIIDLRKQLLGLARGRIRYFKELKGKPIDRVFWQIITPGNMQDAKSLIDKWICQD